MRLAIAIVTYQRPDALAACVKAVESYQPGTTLYGEAVAVIASDDPGGPTLLPDRLEPPASFDRPPVITATRRLGSMGNRNRALFYLLHYTDADTFILLEDDCHPNVRGWEVPWVAAAKRFGHVATAHPPGIVSGHGTGDDPFLSDLCEMQCVALTRAAVLEVGYCDPRFKPPYGHADTEWRWRYGKWNGTKRYDATLGLRSGLDFKDFGTHRDEMSVAANDLILSQIRHEPKLYRDPWLTAADNLELVRECLAAARGQG